MKEHRTGSQTYLGLKVGSTLLRPVLLADYLTALSFHFTYQVGIQCTFWILAMHRSAWCMTWAQYMLVPSFRQAIEYLNKVTRAVEGAVIILIPSIYYLSQAILGTSLMLTHSISRTTPYRRYCILSPFCREGI